MARQPGAELLKAQFQLALVRVDMDDGHRQQLPRRWILAVGMAHQIHCQIRNMHQSQPVLRAQPAQKLHGPLLLAMLLQPHLLSVALVLPTDLDRLPQGILQRIQLFPQLGFRQPWLLFHPGNQLAMGQQVGVTTNG